MCSKKLIPLLLCVLTLAFQQRTSAATSETGEWSKEVNGIQGRLIVSVDPMLSRTQMIVVYLELRNVSDFGNPLEIYYTGGNTDATVTNKQNKVISRATTFPADIQWPAPYWLILPYDSSLRFRISVTGYMVPTNGGALLGLSGPWVLADSDAPFFLQGTFNAAPSKDRGERRPWQGTLELPKVKIPMPAAAAKAP